jgi:hypothetical protein
VADEEREEEAWDVAGSLEALRGGATGMGRAAGLRSDITEGGAGFVGG